MSLLCWSCWFHRVAGRGEDSWQHIVKVVVLDLWRRPSTFHGLQIVENIVEVQLAPVVEYDATPVTTMAVLPTVTVPIATQMVHGTKTFEFWGTAPVHQ